MRMLFHALVVALVVALLSSVACSHDIDALKSRAQGSGGAGDLRGTGGRRPISLPKDAGAGGSDAETDGGLKPDAGDASSGSGGSGAADRCLPCDVLTAEAKDLGLESCCRGPFNRECGLRSPITDECLPLLVPGMPSPTCLPVAGVRLDGCCRPDARCGVDATDTGLGCVEPRQVTSDAMASDGTGCTGDYSCTTDADCAGASGDSVCAVRSPGGQGFCVDVCQRDQDCLSDQVCALTQDYASMRVVASCMPAVGAAKPGETCSTPNDCDHGLCRPGMSSSVCTLVCATAKDCPSELPKCEKMSFADNVMSGTPIAFPICKPLL